MILNMRLLAAVALVLPLLAGCGSAGDSGGSEGLTVVTAFYPLEYVTQRIVGDQAEVASLTSPGTEPHDAELSINQTAEVIDADVLVYLSQFQPAVDDAVAQADDAAMVDAAGSADLLPSDEGDGGDDPHFWLDPVRLAAVAGDVADAVTAADPDNGTAYAENLRVLERDLMELDEEITSGLAECRLDSVVVSHDAFGYWAARYGLDMHPIAGLSPESEPSAAHLAELQELIEAEDITTVFSETLASPKMAETLSGDLGLSTAVLDPVEGLGDETSDQDYLSLMRANLDALQKANDCR
jgi:zinc transport system substrate-binding protein